MGAILSFLKQLVQRLFKYSIYIVFKQDKKLAQAETPSNGLYRYTEIRKQDLATSLDQKVSDQSWYGGTGSFVYAYKKDRRVVAFCVYWFGERYKKRNFWPLAEAEAKLVQVYTLPQERGEGLASKLIRLSGADMQKKGFKTLYARVWHSNYPSRRAFEKCGWKKIAVVFTIQPFTAIRPFRVKINCK